MRERMSAPAQSAPQPKRDPNIESFQISGEADFKGMKGVNISVPSGRRKV